MQKNKKNTTLVVIGLIFCQFISFTQSESFSIPITLEQSGRNIASQIIDISNIKTDDFIAISLKLTGKNINQDQNKILLTNGQKEYHFTRFAENEGLHSDTFVSNLLYLEPKDAGIWRFELNDEPLKNSGEDLQGFLRVFVPHPVTNHTLETYSNYTNNVSENCTCQVPSHINRQDWGAPYGLSSQIFQPPAAYTRVTHLIVHHSAGINVSSNWKGVVASIFDFHVRTNGWQDIGYNWLIDPNGIIYEGRGGGENVRGAHMCGYNNNTMGVCVLGNFEIAEPTDLALDALSSLLAYKACKEDITTDGVSNINSYPGIMHHISGHMQGCAPGHTSCPGKNLFSKLPSIRVNTQEFIMDQCSTTTSVENFLIENLTLYPNPIKSMLCIKNNGPMNIYDSFGNMVNKLIKPTNDECYDVSLLPSGLYIVQQYSGRYTHTLKFVKE